MHASRREAMVSISRRPRCQWTLVLQLAIREICFREIDLKSQFVKYECLENDRLYGIPNTTTDWKKPTNDSAGAAAAGCVKIYHRI